ncbi:uncharacterized protein M421DRAFT_224838 [Didymella exigua CBS 183.55]|uniref:Uncharacterized protein n=1 Tax=Didymella exigua CBS 183.55 TaxID=1150837 RepID=A0A6A5REJ1_9PLEO|nr:uncharacterized protein M421DRAFT_224838 [Didymella exigua CBS 183.55]KAF1926102.1 hypothetical protein M421DRAFT_224838 [Didymella exigua CBS 183.55]
MYGWPFTVSYRCGDIVLEKQGQVQATTIQKDRPLDAAHVPIQLCIYSRRQAGLLGLRQANSSCEFDLHSAANLCVYFLRYIDGTAVGLVLASSEMLASETPWPGCTRFWSSLLVFLVLLQCPTRQPRPRRGYLLRLWWFSDRINGYPPSAGFKCRRQYEEGHRQHRSHNCVHCWQRHIPLHVPNQACAGVPACKDSIVILYVSITVDLFLIRCLFVRRKRQTEKEKMGEGEPRLFGSDRFGEQIRIVAKRAFR